MLLKLDTREAEKKEEEGEFVARTGYTEFVSHTIWAHQMDFEEWKRRYCDAWSSFFPFVVHVSPRRPLNAYDLSVPRSCSRTPTAIVALPCSNGI